MDPDHLPLFLPPTIHAGEPPPPPPRAAAPVSFLVPTPDLALGVEGADISLRQWSRFAVLLVDGRPVVCILLVSMMGAHNKGQAERYEPIGPAAHFFDGPSGLTACVRMHHTSKKSSPKFNALYWARGDPAQLVMPVNLGARTRVRTSVEFTLSGPPGRELDPRVVEIMCVPPPSRSEGIRRLTLLPYARTEESMARIGAASAAHLASSALIGLRRDPGTGKFAVFSRKRRARE